MKKTAKIIVATAACACLVGASGCAAATNSLSVDSYWYIDTFEGIQRTSVLDDEENANRTAEVLLYELNFEQPENGNAAYRVEYYTDSENFDEGDNAHYFKTTFYAKHFDWSTDTNEKYTLTANDINAMPEEDQQRITDGTQEVLYVLETEMRVSGRYVLGDADTAATGENSVEFSDYMTTTTYFRSARNGLEPVYSKQRVHTTSPATLAPVTVEDMCRQFEYSYEVFYNFDCTEATYTYTEHYSDDERSDPEEYTVDGLKNTGYTLFDNNSLYNAIRGMSLSENFGTTLSLFTPANYGVFNVNVTGGAQGELDLEADADIISALTSAYGEFDIPPAEENGDSTDNGEDGTQETEEHSYIYYNPAYITAASELHGTTQTAWFAAVNISDSNGNTLSDEDNNVYRATMLRLTVPVSYSLGTIEYRLAEVVSVLGGQA